MMQSNKAPTLPTRITKWLMLVFLIPLDKLAAKNSRSAFVEIFVRYSVSNAEDPGILKMDLGMI